jgi:hypothetical protein
LRSDLRAAVNCLPPPSIAGRPCAVVAPKSKELAPKSKRSRVNFSYVVAVTVCPRPLPTV